MDSTTWGNVRMVKYLPDHGLTKYYHEEHEGHEGWKKWNFEDWKACPFLHDWRVAVKNGLRTRRVTF